MKRPYPLDLADTAPRQLRRALDGLTRVAQSDDALMGSGVGLATGVLASHFRELDALALSLAPRLIVVTGHL